MQVLRYNFLKKVTTSYFLQKFVLNSRINTLFVMNANFLVEKIEIFLSYLIISQQDTTIQMDKGNEISF